MTEKRFKSINCGLQGQYIKDEGVALTIDEVVELLNELHDENIELHIQNDFLKDENQHMRDLVNENKQLKQSNERLLKMLDNVANYMQRQNKDVPLNDFVEWWNTIATEGLDD